VLCLDRRALVDVWKVGSIGSAWLGVARLGSDWFSLEWVG